jgi:WD40 repeat protein
VDPLQVGDPSRVGRYRLLGRLGEGGMGRVYLGVSPGGRKVAIKVVHYRFANNQEFRRRFAREVAAARRVGGFHTAPVVDAAPDANPPWMATAYIAGPSLADAIAQRGPLDEAEVRELGAALAEGLMAIHDCGIIHRDLKPANVILADDGPRIIDFGIAKAADASAITAPHAFIGTPAYMSPEQLNAQDLTPLSDVFALGTVLAYAATGHDAFEGPVIPAVMNHILNDPPNLDSLAEGLRDIISACLDKDPRNRPSPDDLLARFSPPDVSPPDVASDPARQGEQEEQDLPPRATGNGPETETAPRQAAPAEPVPQETESRVVLAPEARPEARPEAPARGRRYRGYWRLAIPVAAVAATAGGITALILLLPGSHLAQGPTTGPTATQHPTTSGPTTGKTSASTPPASRSAATFVKATATLAATMKNHPPGDDDSAAFDPKSKILAVGGTVYDSSANPVEGRTFLWNTATKKVTAILIDPGGSGVNSVAFAPNGTTLATADSNGNTYLWNIATKSMIATLPDPTSGGASSVAFAPNGTTLATGDRNGITYLWNTATKTITATFHAPNGGLVISVAFAPGGTTLATGTVTEKRTGSTYLWSTTTKKITGILHDPASGGADALAFAPNGTTLAVGDGNGSAYLWNTATKTITATLNDPSAFEVEAVAFAPDGTTLAAGDFYGYTNLWNTTTDRITATFHSPSISVEWVAFSANGLTLATGASHYNFNSSTYLWHITYHRS